MKKPVLKTAITGNTTAQNILRNDTPRTLEEKRKEIHRILDYAEAALQALDCPYFLAAIDKDTRDPDGGKVFVNLEVDGPNMAVFMQHAFPSNKDLIFLGLAVGNEIQRRNKEANISFREKKRKPAKFYKIDCPKCKAAKMYETDKLVRAPYTEECTLAALECRKCGTLIEKPAQD